MRDPRDVLLRLFRVGLDAVEPERALGRALTDEVPAPADRTWVLGLGKAAHPMSRAAIRYLRTAGLSPAGGLVIGAEPGPKPAPGLEVVAGDHPLPGPGSFAAAEALEITIRSVLPGDDVWVLLSGGTTSLMAAPVRGISEGDLHQTYETMLHSGLDIHDMNRVRKRISRWGGGRLAAALAHANVRVFAISDVIGDDLASIGSGPCAPDPSTAGAVRAMLAMAGLDGSLPGPVNDLLERVARGLVPETPKPGDAVFRNVETHIIASNRIAVEAVADEAVRQGYRVRVRRKPIVGEAAHRGTAIAHHLIGVAGEARAVERLHAADSNAADRPLCYVAGGETTVTLPDATGHGGRCQELGLAAARVLAGGSAPGITLLAAGTDGRDGPTEAAGAIVDNDTWGRIRAAGRDPAADLEHHDAHRSLDAADALLRTGPTGTNVADLIIAVAV